MNQHVHDEFLFERDLVKLICLDGEILGICFWVDSVYDNAVLPGDLGGITDIVPRTE